MTEKCGHPNHGNPDHSCAPFVSRCRCGGRIVPETRRGVEHLICTSCSVCDQCDAAGRKTYGPHAAEATS